MDGGRDAYSSGETIPGDIVDGDVEFLVNMDRSAREPVARCSVEVDTSSVDENQRERSDPVVGDSPRGCMLVQMPCGHLGGEHACRLMCPAPWLRCCMGSEACATVTNAAIQWLDTVRALDDSRRLLEEGGNQIKACPWVEVTACED